MTTVDALLMVLAAFGAVGLLFVLIALFSQMDKLAEIVGGLFIVVMTGVLIWTYHGAQKAEAENADLRQQIEQCEGEK